VYRVGDATLLDDVSIEVDANALVAIVGPNGAGKTTLVRLLGGEIEPASGRVILEGEDVAGLAEDELALRRALLTEGPSDIPFPVRSVVGLGRTPHRRDPDNSAARDAALIDSVIARFGLAALESRIYASLSGGEQSLTSLARVVAQETPLLLLDEPTAALDVAHQERVLRVLVELAGEGRLILAVVHDLNLAARYARRVMVLAGGRVMADGAPASVLTSELLSDVYDHPMRVVEHPLRGGPLVLVD
jgi:iron complex transport system ATP-binding protein